jgi:hypothetical protein
MAPTSLNAPLLWNQRLVIHLEESRIALIERAAPQVGASRVSRQLDFELMV